MLRRHKADKAMLELQIANEKASCPWSKRFTFAHTEERNAFPHLLWHPHWFSPPPS